MLLKQQIIYKVYILENKLINAILPYKSIRRELVKKIYFKLFRKKKYKVELYYCPVCKNKIEKFLPLPKMYEENSNKYGFKHFYNLETLSNKYHCPKCGASDRTRFYTMYIDKYVLNKRDKCLKLLHFSPERQLLEKLKNLKNIEYYSADISSKAVDYNIDITDMKEINAETFDCFICSHVLEHVEDDKKALNELFRILKRGGWGILMVPISKKLKETIEDPTITDTAERWRLFGQDDHVRLYERSGFIERIKNAGFEVELKKWCHFGPVKFYRTGLTFTSTLYIVRK